MLADNIKTLLDSSSAEDNTVGLELLNGPDVKFSDVKDYLESTKVAAYYVYRYVWSDSQGKFIRNNSENVDVYQM